MYTTHPLSSAQQTEFVRQGYLVVPGELSQRMICQLLQALEEGERNDSRDAVPLPRTGTRRESE